MATSSLVLNTSYQLVATGCCHVTVAKLGLYKPEGVSVLSSIEKPSEVLVTTGTVLPDDDIWEYKDFTEEFLYNGSESVYMRTVSGEIPIKIDTF